MDSRREYYSTMESQATSETWVGDKRGTSPAMITLSAPISSAKLNQWIGCPAVIYIQQDKNATLTAEVMTGMIEEVQKDRLMLDWGEPIELTTVTYIFLVQVGSLDEQAQDVSSPPPATEGKAQ